MYPDTDESAVDVSLFRNLKGVTDVVYNPLKTKLYLDCERQGISCECGLYMLVAQAVFASQIFSGKTFDVKKTADEVYGRILNEKRNIVLIGMPGSGKTTVGKALAETLGRRFADTDDLITEEYGCISDIFAEKKTGIFFAETGRKIHSGKLLRRTYCSANTYFALSYDRRTPAASYPASAFRTEKNPSAYGWKETNRNWRKRKTVN